MPTTPQTSEREIRVLPAQDQRVETGPVQFGDDWPGVFIRGDNAFYYAWLVRAVIEGHADPLKLAQLRGLHDALADSDLTGLSRAALAFQQAPADVRDAPNVEFDHEDDELSVLVNGESVFAATYDGIGSMGIEAVRDAVKAVAAALAASPLPPQKQPESVHLGAASSGTVQAAGPSEAARDVIRELLTKHATLIEEGNHYAYFELAYTRQTGWMAWLTDRPAKGEPGTAEYAQSRKAIARGQGDTPDEACADALFAMAQPPERSTQRDEPR